jgi:CO/xanthine dehydrogenase FAD-binding subunit
VLASDVHFPKDLSEALETLHRLPGALVFAGGTEILREQGGIGLSLPPEILHIRDLPELRRAGLTERFLEIGSAVTLAELLELGETALPPLLADAIRGIGSPAIRNLGTIGGSIASKGRFMDTWPALACLDALIELRDLGGSTWMNVNRLVGDAGRPSFPEGGLMTRVRVPIERWDASLLRKVGPSDYPAPDTAVFAFAARAEKGILVEMRIAFAGETALRSRGIEASAIGRGLPLSQHERDALAGRYRELASGLPEGLALQFGALVDAALGMLSS